MGGEQERPRRPRGVMPTNPKAPEAATLTWPSATWILMTLARWQLSSASRGWSDPVHLTAFVDSRGLLL